MRPSIWHALWLSAAIQPGCTCTDTSDKPQHITFHPVNASSQTRLAKPAATPLAPIVAPFSETFSTDGAPGADWLATDTNAYRVVKGELVVQKAYNHPLWLRHPIPQNATIEFDCWSNDDAGDLKVEIWGDGQSSATARGAYTSTSYNFIFGGWHNQLSTLARLDEHGQDRLTRAEPRVVKGQKYHWTIARDGEHIAWSIDGQPFLTLDDPEPLSGDDHRFFAINDWEAELHFDNLKITPK